jgi:8-oxo-dGTP pyrophosphatase MutT (NUDIX family)
MPARVRVSDIQAALALRPPETLALPEHGHAAVLVPLLQAPSGLRLLLTVRAAGLTRHAGQIAFPGGRLEAGEDTVAAALREAREEVGLAVAPGMVLGRLDDRTSPTGLIATPVVAVVPWLQPQALVVEAGEVAEVFSVDLQALWQTPVRWETWQRDGRTRRLARFDIDNRCIWGLTGMVIHDLFTRLRETMHVRDEESVLASAEQEGSV